MNDFARSKKVLVQSTGRVGHRRHPRLLRAAVVVQILNDKERNHKKHNHLADTAATPALFATFLGATVALAVLAFVGEIFCAGLFVGLVGHGSLPK